MRTVLEVWRDWRHTYERQLCRITLRFSGSPTQLTIKATHQ
jgi:hypothetical protein